MFVVLVYFFVGFVDIALSHVLYLLDSIIRHCNARGSAHMFTGIANYLTHLEWLNFINRADFSSILDSLFLVISGCISSANALESSRDR